MPDVGVLQLSIQDNSEQAAGGLNALADALSRVRQAVGKGLSLGDASKSIIGFVKNVEQAINSSAIKDLSSFFNALSSFSEVKKFNIDTEQLEKLKTVMEGDWDATGAVNSMTQIASGAIYLRASDAATTMSNAAASMQEYARAAKALQNVGAQGGQGVGGLPGGIGGDMNLQQTAVGSMVQDATEQTQEELGQIFDPVEEQLETVHGAIQENTEATQEFLSTLGEGPIIYQSIEEAARAMGISVEEAKAMAQGTYDAMMKASEAGPVYQSIEEAARAMGTSIEEAKEKVVDVNKLLGAASNVQEQMQEVKAAVSEAVDTSVGGNAELIPTDKFIETYSHLDYLKGKLDDLKSELDTKRKFGLIDKDGIDQAVSQIRKLQTEISKLEQAQSGLTGGGGGGFFQRFTDGLKDMKSSIKQMFPTLTGLISRFGQIVKYRMLRAILKNITEGFKEGVQNVYEYSKAVGTSFAPAMDSAASIMSQFKNAIGAAAAPAIQALIPVLNSVATAAINVINVINQLFSLLSGKATWTRALPQATKAFNTTKKAASGAAAAIKDLLADWDELNIIQSEGGGGGGGATDISNDFANMFEEVGEFDKRIKDIVDFIKKHFDEILTLVKDIGAAMLLWKVSNALSGLLGDLATLAAIGYLIKVTFDATVLLDEAYVESGNIGFLAGDLILTGALAGITKKLADAHFGEGVGTIFAGVTFAVSAGATFFVASNTADEAKKKMLELLGGVKFGIAAALLSSGLIAAGFGTLSSIALGIISAAIITYITYSVAVNAEAEKTAEEAAKAAFAATGEGGIDPASYVTALQDEFKKMTAGTQLVIDAYVTVPDLQTKLFSAMASISSFNQIIFKGSGKLTEEDAKSFKDNWTLVLETLKKMNTAKYDTILAGLTEALSSKNEELRKEAEKTRTTFIMLEQNISAENAEIYKHMEELSEKMAKGDTSDETLKEYERYYSVFAASTRTGLEDMNKALRTGKNIDFGDTEHAVENAKEFINSIGEAATAAKKAEEEALADIEESVEWKKGIEKAKLDADLITKDEYDARIKALDDVLGVATSYAEEKKKEIDDKIQEAYDIVFKQALTAENANTEQYWQTVLLPLMREAKEAGYNFPEELVNFYKEGINSGIMAAESIDPEGLVKQLKEDGIIDPAKVAEAIQESARAQFGQHQDEEWFSWLKNIFWVSENNVGLTPTQVEAQNLIGVEGWDMLSDELKAFYKTTLEKAFGEEATREILKHLGEDTIQGNDTASGITDTVEEAVVNSVNNMDPIDTTPEVTVTPKPSVEDDVDIWDLGELSSTAKETFDGIQKEAEDAAESINSVSWASIDELKRKTEELKERVNQLSPETVLKPSVDFEEDVDIWELMNMDTVVTPDITVKPNWIPEEEDVDIWDLTGKNVNFPGASLSSSGMLGTLTAVASVFGGQNGGTMDVEDTQLSADMKDMSNATRSQTSTLSGELGALATILRGIYAKIPTSTGTTAPTAKQGFFDKAAAMMAAAVTGNHVG